MKKEKKTELGEWLLVLFIVVIYSLLGARLAICGYHR